MIPELEPLRDKYEVLHKLREGGMGSIYLVRHRLLEELRVVKVLRPQLQERAEFRARFLREARVAIQLRHPGIAQLFDFATDEAGNGYMVLEFVDGRTLQELIAERRIESLRLVVEIACQTLAALGFLHRRGFVHRDVAPDNVMLTVGADGQAVVKLIDLGIVKVLHAEGKTGTDVFLGKVRYASPEQFEGGEIDARSDLYSMGVLLYELLTGVHPFQGGMHSLISGHLFRAPAPFAANDPEGRVPEALRTLVAHALAKEPGERIASAEEFLTRLEAIELPAEPVPPAAVLAGLCLTGPAARVASLPTTATGGSLAERLAQAEALVASGHPEAAAVLLRQPSDPGAATDAETSALRARVERRVGDELLGKKVRDWKALLDEEDGPDIATGEAPTPAARRRRLRVAAWAGAAAAALALALGFAIARRPGAPEVGAVEPAPAPAPAVPVAQPRELPPAPPPVEISTLVLDALPWGRLVELRSVADGQLLPLAADAYTPLRLELAAGVYEGAVAHPELGRRRFRVELEGGAVARRSVRFGSDLAETFVSGL